MKWYRTLLAIGAATCLAISGAAAAPKPAPSNSLNLTPAQQKQIAGIEAKARKEITAVQVGLGTPAEKQKRIQAIATKYEATGLAVLTPAQRSKVNAQHYAQQKVMQQLQAFEKTITPQQRAKMQSVQKGFSVKANAILRNKKLSDPQKRTQMIALEKQMRSAMQGILTAKQRAMLPGHK